MSRRHLAESQNIDDGGVIGYPDLGPAPSMQVPIQPTDTSTNTATSQTGDRALLSCASCRIPLSLSGQPTTLVTLTCGHQMHGICYGKLQKRFGTFELGGFSHCNHCVQERIDGNESARCSEAIAARLNTATCIDELKRAFAADNPDNDIETVADRDITVDDMHVLLGAGEYDKDRSLIQSIAVTVGNKQALAKAKAEAEQLEEAMALRGSDLIEELLRRGRTLDELLRTRRITAGHLHRVGIRTMEDLERLGFKADVHLSKRFQAALPIYYLVEYFGLSYDKHLRSLSNEAFLAMEPKKQDLFILEVVADHLVHDRKFTPQQLMQLHIRPSSLALYINLEPSHLLDINLGLSTDAIRDNRLWNKDRTEHPFTRGVFETLRQKEKAERRSSTSRHK